MRSHGTMWPFLHSLLSSRSDCGVSHGLRFVVRRSTASSCGLRRWGNPLEITIFRAKTWWFDKDLGLDKGWDNILSTHRSSISWISYLDRVDNLVNMIDAPTLCGTFSALPSTLNILTYHRWYGNLVRHDLRVMGINISNSDPVEARGATKQLVEPVDPGAETGDEIGEINGSTKQS